MDPSYGRSYRELYERHWWWRAREAGILDLLRALRPPSGWRRILDVGCGDGLFFDGLAAFGAVDGVEPSAALVNPDGPHRSRIHVGPFDDSFEPGKDYSLILMLDVLEHMADPAGALRRAVALLAPGGIVVATVPAFNALWTNHDVINHHRTRYTKASLRAIAGAAGLRIVRERYWFQWTCPVKLWIRGMERLLRRAPANPVIPPAPLNRLLYLACRLEQRTLGRIRFPFGSSLVVVGDRRPAVSITAGAPIPPTA